MATGVGAFGRAVLLLGTAFVSGLSAAAASEPLRDNFLHPPISARPWVRWWWPGGAVEDGELRREVDLLEASGFAGAEIQAFNPGITHLTEQERATINDYATPSFLGHVRAAAEQAAARGLQLDYTFGSAWPSGGGFAITPEWALLELTVARTSVEGGTKGPITITVPPRSKKLGALSTLDPRTRDPAVADWRARLDARQKLIAAVAVKGEAPLISPETKPGGFKLFAFGAVVTRPGRLEEGSTLILTDKLRADGTLDWSPPPGHWQVLVFKQYAANMGVMAGVGAGPQLVLDHFNQAAFDAHAQRLGEPLLPALGPARTAVRGTFVDSLELMSDLYWSEDFLQQFEARRGYDLTPYLPLILQPGWMEAWDDHYSPPCYEMGEIGERIRADYQQTVSDLLMERFVAPFVKWNHDHNLLARFQAHGGPLDALRAYGLADIPETEDLYEFADPHFLRLARSAADIYGHSRVSAESLVWKDRPYSVTPDEMRRRADLLFASGVNQLVLHGFPYAFHREAWPGWHAFEPSGFQLGFSSMLAESNPIWMAVPALAGYLGRTQSVLQSGRSVVPVAMYLGEIGYFKGIEDGGAGRREVNKALLSGGYDYDRINDDGLASARVVDHKLVTRGGAEYSALVVPPLASIRVETAERVATLVAQGCPVFFVESPPSRDKGYFDHVARDQRVKQAMASAMEHGGRAVPISDLVARVREAGVAGNLRFTGDAADLLFVQRESDGHSVYFLHNTADQPRDASFDTTAKGVPERWNAFDGSIVAQASTQGPAGTHVPLQLAAGESALLVFTSNTQARKPLKPVGDLTLPAKGWKLHATGHGTGGRVIDVSSSDVELGDWRQMQEIADLSGSAVYTRAFTIEPAWLRKGTHVALDLGEVHDVARVAVNGHLFAPVFGPNPLDITSALHRGPNALTVEVANTPNNALIDPKKLGFKSLKPVAAGWVGPATLHAER